MGHELNVREMLLDDMPLRIDYLRNAPPHLLDLMGVDSAKLPEPDAWLAVYEEDFQRPIETRKYYGVTWELDGTPIGFSSIDRIQFGDHAYMHLHIVDPDRRGSGHGAEFVRMSVSVFFEVFGFERLLSEPNAFNTAPNRTLQKAGFKYVSTQHRSPGPLNFVQTTNLWVLGSGVPKV